MAEVSASPVAYPPSRRAWIMVIVLTIAYVVSFVDRQILNLLIDPIKADLGLRDDQIKFELFKSGQPGRLKRKAAAQGAARESGRQIASGSAFGGVPATRAQR